jgi:small-conductance mechanosensitive channel
MSSGFEGFPGLGCVALPSREGEREGRLTFRNKFRCPGVVGTMTGYLNPAQLCDWVVIWVRSNVLVATNAEQLATVAGIFACFLFCVRPVRSFFVSTVERFSIQAVRQILLPLALTGPWLLLLMALWFATLVFADRHLGTTILRLAESLTLAWVIIKLSSRLVRSDQLARALAVLAFVIAALNIAGLLGTVTRLLDSMAVSVGSLRVSVLLLFKAALTLALFLWLAGMSARVLETRLKRLSELTPATQVLASKLIRFALITLAIIFALGTVGIDLTALAVFTGAVGVGIGLGLQKVVSNLVSGVILLVDHSIKPGDVIEMDGTFGWITSLNARYVSLATRDGKELLIPNEDLITERVTNWSYSNNLIRQSVYVGVSYGSDVRGAMRLAVEAASTVSRVLELPGPACLLKEFGDSAVNLELRFWIQDPANGTANVRSEVMLRIWDLFREHGIEFPFPQRDLTLRNPEAVAEAFLDRSEATRQSFRLVNEPKRKAGST